MIKILCNSEQAAEGRHFFAECRPCRQFHRKAKCLFAPGTLEPQELCKNEVREMADCKHVTALCAAAAGRRKDNGRFCGMKVVLKQDVKSIGKKDELHEVADGYARNYLLPRGLAVAADAAAVNEVRTKAAAVEHRAAQALAAAQELAKKIDGQTVTFKAKAGQGGRVFGAVTAKNIADALGEKVGESIDKRKIVMDGDLKSFGSYEIKVKVYPKVTAKLTVRVEE